MRNTTTKLALALALAPALLLVSGCCCGSLPVGAGGYTPQPSPHIVNATDANFGDIVLASDKPVVVDFWASWCGPCAMLDPTVVKLAEEFKDRVRFVRVNVDESGQTSNEYGVSGIPMLGLFVDGELLDSRVGVEPENALRKWLNEQLAALESEA
jgi:thioredoxin 1